MASGRVTSSKKASKSTSGPEVAVDRHVAVETIRTLKIDRSSIEIDAAFDQAVSFVSKLVACYESGVATNEVGADGSATASQKTPLAGRSPAGLLYGRIQSGKTQAMILSTALAVDNGFRVVVILTSDSVELVRQTFSRFAVLKEAGVNVYSSTSSDEWDREAMHAAEHLPKYGMVVVCAKNKTRLEQLNKFLAHVGAASLPAIIFDDEADQASLDTNNRRRALEAQKDDGNPEAIPGSTINELLVGVDSLAQLLRHSVYVQVTATPFAMLLLNDDDALRPSFVHLLEPGKGYTGGESFFDDERIENESPPLAFVQQNELKDAMASPSQGVPQGLKRSVSYFVVAAICQRMAPESRVRIQCMLCHPGGTRTTHDFAAKMISNFFAELERDICSDVPLSAMKSRPHLEWALGELKKSVPNHLSLEEIRTYAKRGILRTRKFHIVNSDSDGGGFTPEPGLNFVIGGNIIGRGLTIENLLVTYYVRPAQIGQMDTMYQHARMFGYRSPIIQFVRVFIPAAISVRFNAIHVAESELREYLVENGDNPDGFVSTIPGLRPTRPNVLDPSNLATFIPGSQIFPKLTPSYKPSEASSIVETIRKDLQNAMGGNIKPKQLVETTIEVVKNLISAVPVHPDDEETGAWEAGFLMKVLDYFEGTKGKRAFVYFREMKRDIDVFTRTGSATGAELTKARQTGVPVLMLFRDVSKRVGYEFWYPTLVLPKGKLTLITNAS